MHLLSEDTVLVAFGNTVMPKKPFWNSKTKLENFEVQVDSGNTR